MPKLPIVSGIKILKALSKIGFKHIRTSGSHMILTKEQGIKITIPVPNHKEIAKGTLKSIMKQAGINLKELLDLL
jgi:predicted RNA binding protein YcfA (HicA-like mRNA interferase family)